MQREDPDLTQHESISQILLREDLEPQSKKFKLASSSQKQSVLVSYDPRQSQDTEKENDIDHQEHYVTLTPEDVTEIVHGAEYQQCNTKANESGPLTNDALNASGPSEVVGRDFAKPKFSSTPANRKLKKTKAINPEDITEMEVQRADLEAASAIKEAAEKISQAAVAIVNCMQELKPEIKSLANRNYKEIQMSTNAVKQLVSFQRACQSFFPCSYCKLHARAKT